MPRTWRRRNYFIKKELQGRYVFSFFLFVVAGSFFFTVVFSLLSADSLTIVYKHYNLQLGKTPVVLLREILSANWILIAAGGAIVVLSAIFLTHRFAGPLYRFERSVEQLIDGNLNFEIRLRKRDEAKELADLINTYTATLSKRIGEMQGLADSAAEQLAAARSSGSGAALDEAAAANARLRELLQGFRLKNEP